MERLWKASAQRNVRNEWSKLSSLRRQWTSASSTALSHATSLVNAFLSHKYIPSMDLGVLTNMPALRNKASFKLLNHQQLHRNNLLSSYRDMVHVVTQMVKCSTSMRCYLKGTTTAPLLKFSHSLDDKNDAGDGGGIPVFTSWPISCFEKYAEEILHMLVLELNLKRLLVVELVSMSCEPSNINWSNELYVGEFDDLDVCRLFSGETCEPLYPISDKPTMLSNSYPNQETLQVYLTTWLVEVHIDNYRVDEIFAEIGEEMHVNLS